MQLTLYRGIAVRPEDAEDVKQRILAGGLVEGQGRRWRLECVDLRSRLVELLEKPDLTLLDTRHDGNAIEGCDDMTRQKYHAVCACGDMLGASFYALKHNRAPSDGLTHGLVVTFTADVNDVTVDGRDFLYNSVFGSVLVPEQRKLAFLMFGECLGKYLDHSIPGTESSYRFSICDLAVQDEEVVMSHARNSIVIGGRCGTVFRSAFLVRLPIAANHIVSVEDAVKHDFKPQVTTAYFHVLGETA